MKIGSVMDNDWRREIDHLRDHMADLEQRFEARRIALDQRMEDRRKETDRLYVTKVEFTPIQRLLWLVVTIMVTGVTSAVLALVIRSGGILK